MSEISPIKVNCFPSCSNSKIAEQLVEISPCIDIVRLSTALPLQANSGAEDTSKADQLNKLLKYADGLRKKEEDGKESAKKNVASIGQSIGGINYNYSSTDADNVHFLDNFYGFFSMMTAEADLYSNNIPIISSPQIKIDTSNGWKQEQSLLGFIKNISNSGAIGGLLNAVNLSGVVNGVIDEIERIGGMAGWSPRIGPYFSLQDNPFNDRPSLAVEIKLINDTKDAAMTNSVFLDLMLRNSLIGTDHAVKSGGSNFDYGTVTGNGLFNSWRPPKLFNVGLKWGATSKTYVKRYYLCTLDATVQPEGVLRRCHNGRVPDAYALTMTFNSLVPNTLDFWTGYGFSFSLDGGSDLQTEVNNMEKDIEEKRRNQAAIDQERRRKKSEIKGRVDAAIKQGNWVEARALAQEWEQNGWEMDGLGHAETLINLSDEQIAKWNEEEKAGYVTLNLYEFNSGWAKKK